MEKMYGYVTPQVRVIKVAVEKGFAWSGEGGNEKN